MTQETFTSDVLNDPLFERKLETAVDGLSPYFRKCILNFLPENTKLVVDFINSELQYNNTRVLTKKNKIQAVDEFTKFLRKKYGHEIPLKQVGREDFEDFQSSKRKNENEDPLHKWVGTYNQFLRSLKPFFKYVYYPDLPPKERTLPDLIKGINPLKRKEKTCYTASDMWTDEDDETFLKYCEDPLIRLYHMLSRDFSNRPGELLAKRIRDFTEEIDVNGIPYMTTTIGQGGKTTIRDVGALKGHTHYVEYIQKYHPTPTDPNSFLFRNRGRKFHYRNSPIKTSTLDAHYWRLHNIFFPRILESSEVPTEDKEQIKRLLKKPWKPYVRRHTGLTDK
jgi:integrase/recombinase XerD